MMAQRLLLALALATPPALCGLVLAAGGWIGAWPAAVVVAAGLAGGGAAVMLWSRDLLWIENALRHAAAGDTAGLARAAAGPRLTGAGHIAAGIERLARSLAARGAEVTALSRASEAIVERLPDPLIVLGAQREVLRANAAARAAFGSEMAAVLRHPLLREAIERAWHDGASASAEIHLPVPTPREVAATVLPFDPPLADGGRAILVLSDRSRERALERTRADFVANASHELRTPLASLMGFVETLRGPAADDRPAQQRFLGIMAEQAQRMANLIDDLLSLSRIEMNEHQAPSEAIDLAALAGRVAAGFEPRLAARAMRLELAVPAPTMVLGDADQLAQVLQNLVDNAVKYGREGGTVRIAVEPAAGPPWPARPGAALSVADDGQGIARVHLARLTERFYRVDKGRSRAAGGTGLGLAIVKHIVNRHRGQLLIESEEGRGSTFRVWLPAPEAKAP
ncbi:MAG: two-component sensor histidine kinase [Rhodospirillales bacterium]|nr:two-component sensor histidine kinase [Rhodospirillales bacterium]